MVERGPPAWPLRQLAEFSDLVLGDKLTGGLASKLPSLDFAGFLFTCDAVP
jgi:hypothetical protein